MPLPEAYLPRKGDVLSIDVEVKHDVKKEDDYVFTKVVGSYADVAFTLDDPDVAVRLKRRSWREDEGVVHNNVDRWWGKVITLHGDHVLVALDDTADRRHCPGGLRIFHCNELLPWPGAKPAAQEPPEAPAEPKPDIAGKPGLMENPNE